MAQKIGESKTGHLPVLPEEWHKIGPALSEGLDADYLLIDPGPANHEIRYTVVELRSKTYKPHFCDALADLLSFCFEAGRPIRSFLLAPVERGRDRHRGHVGALYCTERAFDAQDMERLKRVAGRLPEMLG